MAQRERSKELKAWLDRQVLSQPDGTYLIRPYLPARMVYEVSTNTKGRWIAFQLAHLRYSLIAALAYFAITSFTSYGQPWIGSWGLAGLIAIIMVVGFGGSLFILKGAKRVSRDRWTKPAATEWISRHSHRYYLIMMIVEMLLVSIIAGAAWLAWRTSDVGRFWTIVPAFLLFGTGSVLMAIAYRRTPPKRP